MMIMYGQRESPAFCSTIIVLVLSGIFLATSNTTSRTQTVVPAFTGLRGNLLRSCRDSDVIISSLIWIARGHLANPAGESVDGPLRLDFDRRVKLEFHGSRINSDAGLLAYRKLDDALGLSAMAGDILADTRMGKNGRHALVGSLRQSVFGRLAGYEDVNDADRLRHDPAMRWIVGGKTASGAAASRARWDALRRAG